MPTNLNPKSQTSAVILTSTGSTDSVTGSLPFGIYTGSADFISGCMLFYCYFSVSFILLCAACYVSSGFSFSSLIFIPI